MTELSRCPREIEQDERMFGLPKVHVAPTRPARRRAAATAERLSATIPMMHLEADLTY
jgi:hypothetical protein